MMTDDPGKMATDQTGLAQKTPRSEDGDPRWGSSTKAKQKNQSVTDCITSTSRRPDLIILFKRTKINRNEDKQVMLSYQWGVVASIDNVNSYIATAVIPCCRTE